MCLPSRYRLELNIIEVKGHQVMLNRVGVSRQVQRDAGEVFYQSGYTSVSPGKVVRLA